MEEQVGSIFGAIVMPENCTKEMRVMVRGDRFCFFEFERWDRYCVSIAV